MEQRIRLITSADGVRIAYATVGAGPPLLRTAHWLSHLDYDWQSPVWRPWLQALARRYTLIRYDPRGCGLSDWAVDELSFDAALRDLEAVIAATGRSRFALLGMSQGGPLAIAYAVRHPERVSHLILYGSYVRGRAYRSQAPEHHAESELLLKLVELGWGQENPAFRQVFTSLFLPEGTLEQLRWFNDLQRVSTSPANAARIIRGFDALDVRDLARQVAVPTLVMHARGDARVPFEEGRLTASLIPDAQFVPLESKNHVLLEHEPAWQHFLATLDAFLGSERALGEAPPPQPLPELTRREREILEQIARGHSNPVIAERLSLSPKTVRNHVTNIFAKLAITTRAEAVARARDAGLGQPPAEHTT
jgi:pimeloyl-ACP methyl ester carboxylesterase/DNA-binding CsgD family transcriptional regulator